MSPLRAAIGGRVGEEWARETAGRGDHRELRLVVDVAPEDGANLVAEPDRFAADARRLKSAHGTEHVIADEQVGAGELGHLARALGSRHVAGRRGAEMAVEDQRADSFGPPPATRKDRPSRDSDARILEVLEHAVRPALRKANAVVEKPEDRTSRLRGSVVETITPGGRVVGDNRHASRSVRPCLSRGDDELAGCIADDVEHVAKRSRSRPRSPSRPRRSG